MSDDVVELFPPARGERSLAPKVRSGILKTAERKAAVLRLRRAGASSTQIAEVLTRSGTRITKSGVERIVAQALQDLRSSDLASVENVRAEQLDRIDSVMQRLWPAVQDGNLKAIDRFVALERLRAAIAGTLAPTKVEHSGQVDHRVSAVEVRELEQAWLESGGVDGTAVEISAGG